MSISFIQNIFLTHLNVLVSIFYLNDTGLITKVAMQIGALQLISYDKRTLTTFQGLEKGNIGRRAEFCHFILNLDAEVGNF